MTMGYRKLPYGYKMVMGETQIHEEEAGYVKQIFQDYLAGASFMTIARGMAERTAPFDGQKPWNKNMVARLLDDDRYVGQKGFPPIISPDTLDTARRRRKAVGCSRTPTGGERVARQLAGGQLSEVVERQLLALLSGLAQAPEGLDTPRPQKKYGCNPNREELEAVLRQLPIDEDQAKELIIQGAVAAYESIPNEEYEAIRIRSLFERLEPPLKELDADLLNAAISKITVRNGNLVSIELLSGQTIEYSTER